MSPAALRDRARELRRNSTDVERILWRALRSRRFRQYKFRRQHPIGRFIVDFACPAKSVVVELDGGQHASRNDSDERRSRHLRCHGYRVVRFWNTDVMFNLNGVLQRLCEVLEDDPSP